MTATPTRSATGFGGPSHLARRFLASLWPGGPRPADDAWARSFLTVGEQALWEQMSGPDRRHAVAVARRFSATAQAAVTAATQPAATQSAATAATPAATQPATPAATQPAALPAALLHDVGKVDAGLGPLRRAAVTTGALALGRDRIARGQGRAARYLRHDAIGAALLTEAGSDALTSAWAREHHLPPDRWTIPVALGSALKAADDD